MTSITDVPEDLLYYLSLNFERDRHTLYSLNLVCHKFYHATQALLFRHVGRISADQAKLLSRSLSEVPELKTHVQSYHISLNGGRLDEDRLKEALDCPNIKELWFSRYDKPRGGMGGHLNNMKHALKKFRDGRSVEHDFECSFLDAYSLDSIRRIRLELDFTTTELIRFMLVPNVTSLSATRLDIMKAPLLSAEFAYKTSALTSLDILGGSLWRMDSSTLRTILSFCPHLRSLRCQIPMQTLHDSHTDLTSRVTQPVSPGDFTAVLRPVRDTLQELSLLNLRHRVPYDGSQIDLSHFPALVELEITSCCLLPAGPPCPERDLMCRLLPKNLRRLKLDFPRESGIFYHHLEGEAFLSQDPNCIPESRYQWILALLRQKTVYAPALVDVSMVDPPGSVGYCRWQLLDWALPDDVMYARDNGGVNLAVQFSCPEAGSNMDSWNKKRLKSRHEIAAYAYRQ